MNSLKNIRIAFLLNLVFAFVELVGGFITNSIFIISDSIHDFGDALSIMIALLLEKKSSKKPDKNYTFGYLRFSVLGALITSTFLIIGSTVVFYNAIPRLFNPTYVNSEGMIILATIGLVVNLIAMIITRDKKSVNENAVSLHMMEDLLGCIATLVGSIIIRICGLYVIDSILSIIIACYILVHVIRNYKNIFNIFLEKAPSDVNQDELKKHLSAVNNVVDIHHIHIWTMDGINNYATVHVLVEKNIKIEELENIKKSLKEELKEHNICHSSIEFETEKCLEDECVIKISDKKHIHNHNH